MSSRNTALARALSPLPPFPANLTAGERRAVEAVIEHGEDKRAAMSMGVSPSTLRTHTQAARYKAGVTSTVRLVVLYLRAQGVAS